MDPTENESPGTEDTTADASAVAEVPAAGADSGAEGAAPAPTLADAIAAGIESAPERGPKAPVQEGAKQAEGEEDPDAAKGEEEEGSEKPAKPGEEKPDEKGEKKDPDHVNDPVPKEWSERARERITSLVSTVKEKDATIENQGQLINGVISTGASPEQFAGILTYLRNLNSSDPADLEQCLKDMDNMRTNIALRLGKPVEGIDFLKDYEDLQQAVKYGQITQGHAQEIAMARTRSKQTESIQTRERETKTATEAAEKERNTAITTMNELGAHLAKTDPDFVAKHDLIMGPLTAAMASMPPSQWKPAFERAYAAVKLPPKPVAAQGAPPAGMERDAATGQFVQKKKPQPIRPMNPGGTGSSKAAPKSLREAIDFSLMGDGG